MGKQKYKRIFQYAEMLMQHNRDNPNVSDEQADFLEKLAQYRHLLHASPQQYFFNTKKTFEIDRFFALSQSQAYFDAMGLPFPKDIFNLMNTLQENRELQFTDFDKAVEQYAYNTEAINNLIERYLRQVDEEKGTLYCPSGTVRAERGIEDPVKYAMAKLKKSQLEIAPYQEKIMKKLARIDSIPEKKLIRDTGLDL